MKRTIIRVQWHAKSRAWRIVYPDGVHLAERKQLSGDAAAVQLQRDASDDSAVRRVLRRRIAHLGLGVSASALGE